MVGDLLKLYSYNAETKADRRQNNSPVNFDRRSGEDRRAENRMNLQPALNNDVLQIKSEVDELYSSFKGFDSISDTHNEFYKDILVKKRKQARNKEIANIAVSSIPMARRISGIGKAEEDNKIKTVGLTALALTNGREDLRDIMSIFGKTKYSAKKGFVAKYGFLVGTTIEDKLQKTSFGKNILTLDRTIGDFISDETWNKLGVARLRDKCDKHITHLSGNVETVRRRYVGFFGDSKLVKLLGRTAYRIPILTLIVAGLLELPNIIKVKKDDKWKQAVNSALSVGLSVGTGALFSAALAPISPVLPIFALGLGYYAGSKLAKKIGFKLDKA